MNELGVGIIVLLISRKGDRTLRTHLFKFEAQDADGAGEGRSATRPRPLPQRSGLNAALSSSVKITGCSHAAKWPPLSTSWK